MNENYTNQLKSIQNQWKSMIINDKPWKSIKNQWTAMKHNDRQLKSKKTMKNQWKYMKINISQYKPDKLWSSMPIIPKTMKINENP